VPKTDPADDLGLFGPDSVTWRVHAEPIMLLAGLRSLYFQGLHPRAMAGMAQNSAYKSDPWGRLLRTVQYVGTTVYGTTAEAEEAGRRLRALHARLTAVDPDTGESFRIDDPDLLRWVHVTEVESFLTTARRAGVDLSDADADAYYAEQRRVAALVGLDPATVPGSVAEVSAYFEAVRPQLRMTRDAADTLLFITVPPMPKRLLSAAPLARPLWLTPARLGWIGLASTAFAMLPRWARRIYGMPGLPTTDLTASLYVRALRLTLGTLPHRLYEGPIYKAAMERVEKARARATTPSTRIPGTANASRRLAPSATAPMSAAPTTNPM
jgi:uncharacterized protein (DUF2236 family)